MLLQLLLRSQQVPSLVARFLGREEPLDVSKLFRQLVVDVLSKLSGLCVNLALDGCNLG